MISEPVLAAVTTLQQLALRSYDGYDLDRVDRALDELLRSPSKTAPAAFQRRSALANAAKVLQTRRALAPGIVIDPSDGDASDPSSSDGAIDELDIRLWLETTPALTADQRDLLRALADGADAESLAQLHGIPVQRVRERISRARRVGWAAYQREVGQ
ncbi:hypothetical protein [Kribbella swartbergensis]